MENLQTRGEEPKLLKGEKEYFSAELLKEIGNHYGTYHYQQGTYYLDNGCEVFEYTNPKDGLLDWLDTLIEERFTGGDSWDAEIQYIFQAYSKDIKGVKIIQGKQRTSYLAYIDITVDQKNTCYSLGTCYNVADALHLRAEGERMRRSYSEGKVNELALFYEIKECQKKAKMYNKRYK